MGQLRKFWHLRVREKLMFLEALILLLLSNLSVKTVPFKNIETCLQICWNNRKSNAIVDSDGIKNEITLVYLSLLRAASALPWNTLCLSQSIAQLIMLRRRGVPAVLLAGVKSAGDSSLVAHAWVLAGDDMGGNSDRTERAAEYAILMRIGQEPLLISSHDSDLF
jgi:hypothetical protein